MCRGGVPCVSSLFFHRPNTFAAFALCGRPRFSQSPLSKEGVLGIRGILRQTVWMHGHVAKEFMSQQQLIRYLNLAAPNFGDARRLDC